MKFDVTSVCSALMDMLVEAHDEDLKVLQLTKGYCHGVTHSHQERILKHFGDSPRVRTELGGSSLNTLRALAMLGKNVCFAGMIGQDEFGRRIQERMKVLGIESRLQITDQEATGTCVVLVTPDGERTMNTFLGASKLYTRTVIPVDVLRSSQILHISAYQWDSPPQKETILFALQEAKSSGALLSFDLADPFVVSAHRQELLEILDQGVSVVFANQEEARLLLDQSPENAARQLAQRAHGVAVVKIGARGALICDGNNPSELLTIPAQPASVLDTTGAGDMFAAGFLWGLLQKNPLRTCGTLGTLLASDVISHYGAQLSEAGLNRVRHFNVDTVS